MSAQRRDDEALPGDDPVAGLSYMAASRELDDIVEFFEKSEVDVDQLVARLERATAIVDELDRRIRRTRAQVEELVPRLEAASRGEASDEAITGDRADAGDDAPSVVADDPGASEGETLPF